MIAKLSSIDEEWSAFRARFEQKPSQGDIAGVLSRLQILFSASVPLASCIETLESQETNDFLRRALGNIHSGLLEGKSLTATMAAQNGLFPKKVLSMVFLGENSGQLDIILSEVSDSMEKEARLIRRVKSALTYPLILATGSGLVLFGLLEFFIPQLIDFSRSLNTDLGPGLEMMFSIAELMLEPIILFGLVQVTLALWFFLYRAFKTERGRHFKEQVLLATPLLGSVLLEMETLRFAYGLRSLLNCGSPLLKSLTILADGLGYEVLTKEIQETILSIQAGQTLGSSLKKNTRFDHVFTNLVAIGEESADLPRVLESVIRLKTESLDQRLEVMITLIEPIVLGLVGGAVAFVTLMFFLPITRLIQSL